MRFDVSKAYIIIYYLLYTYYIIICVRLRYKSHGDAVVVYTYGIVAGDTHSLCQEKWLFCTVKVFLKSSSLNHNNRSYII